MSCICTNFLLFTCFLLLLVEFSPSAVARSHRRRSLDSDSRFDSSDLSTSTGSRRRHHFHHALRQRFHNVTEQDLRHSPQVRMQVAADYNDRCESGQMGADEHDVTWTKDACEICTCTLSHKVFCRKPECPNLSCSAVHVEGECCPMCPERLCRATDGRYFKDGSEWNLDDCTSCECSNGKILCSVEDCEWKTQNSTRTKIPGTCCPVTPDASCFDESGNAVQVWKEGLCTNCYCNQGERICADEKCPHINCTNPYREADSCCYKCPGAVECVLAPWGSWGECPMQECGGGMRRRYREVVVPPKNGGGFCPHVSEAQQCPSIPCDQIPLCPVTEWTPWGHCTATCGYGKRLRSRERTRPEPRMMPLINCNKTHFREGEVCYAGTCTLSVPIHNLVVDLNGADHCPDVTWSEWGPCSKSCGVGTKTREQITIGNITSDSNQTCHLLTETKKCHGKDCKKGRVNCKTTPWSPWTPCTATCGVDAAQSKVRMVTREAKNGGHPCPAELIITRPCNLAACRDLEPSQSIENDERCISSDGKHRSEGEVWSPVECLTCTCTNQRKNCQPIHCPPHDCANPQKIPGFCCPFCDN